MWELAQRTVFKERARLALSIGGVAVAVLLMLSLSGVYQSYQRRIADFFGSMPADAWVVQSGTANFFHSSSHRPTDRPTETRPTGRPTDDDHRTGC